MQAQVDIGFDQLVKLAKELPKTQWQKLKIEVDNNQEPKNVDADFEQFLLSGPTFSKEQLALIEENRKAINKWRTK